MHIDQASVSAVILLRSALLLAAGVAGEAQADVPRDWRGRGEGTEQVLDGTVKHAGRASGSIRSTGPAGGVGSLSQAFRAERYRGRRLRMTAFVKSEDVRGFAGLWMRVDGKDRTGLAFDNMQDRPIRGTGDWREYAIVLDVPGEAEAISLGLLLSGQGRVWVDDIRVEVVGKEVATTGRAPRSAGGAGRPRRASREAPSNLDFEAGPGIPVRGPEAIVQEQVEAYNRHDLAGFLRTYSPDIRTYTFPDQERDGGLDGMRRTFGRLFKEVPDLRATIAGRIVQGDFVIDHEETVMNGRKMRSIVIYRVEEDKIIEVWFLR